MAATTIKAKELGLKMCEIFGLDPDRVVNIKLTVNPDEPVTVVVDLLPTERDIAQVTRLLQRVAQEEIIVFPEVATLNA